VRHLLPSISSAAVLLVVVVGVGGGAAFLSRLFSFRDSPVWSPPPLRLYDDDDFPDSVTLEGRDETFFDDYRVIRFTATSVLPFVRCDFAVETADGALISAYPSTVSRDGRTTEFRLPEYPPNPLELSFTMPRYSPARVRGVFFLQRDAQTVIRTTGEILFPAEG
jgi:hypothetical protein